MKPANEKNTGSHPMTQISRRDFLRTAAALGLSAGALTIFEQACTTAEILTTTPVPAPLPTATRAATLPPVTMPTRVPTATAPPVATPVANDVSTSLPTATRPPTPTLTPVPAATATPPPTPTPTATPTPQPTATPSPTATPTPLSPTPEPTPRPLFLEDPRMRMGHLLRRAGFGANEEEMDRFLAMGEEATVEYLIEYEAADDSALEKRLSGLGLDLEKLRDLQRWSLLRMIYTQRPLQEKMVLFWHGLLTSAFKKVGKGPYMLNQDQLFRRQALGEYDVLLKAISRDSAMLIWLDSRVNNKKAPNENFARELMELFSMGIGPYTEADVRESARAFTGWGLKKKDFIFRENQHDYGTKTFLGRTGEYSGDDIVDIIMEHPATAQFVCRKLFTFFVHDDPEAATLTSLARTFNDTRYSVKAVMRQILTSPDFYSSKAYRAKIKSPAEFVAGTVRVLGIETDGRPLNALTDRMGQILFSPFDVSGWPGGAAWINSSTLLQRLNFANKIATARSRSFKFDPLQVAQDHGFNTAAAALNHFILLLLDGQAPSQDRQILLDYAQGLDGLSGSGNPSATVDEKLRSLVYLVMSSPDFQLA
ncbi:MAG TPA: DUF1800 domain-containing protein [Dehalococcoidia bacterium]|nr:DUF1800 domain-containing protein [Dehalococcoidia bacterium]